MDSPKQYLGEVVEVLETGEAVLTLPNDLLNELGWKEGDTLDLDMQEDGTIVITKVKYK